MLEIKAKNFSSEIDVFIDRGFRVIELCQNASRLYLDGNDDFKKRLIKLLCLNLFYDGQKLTIEPKKAVEPMLKTANLKNGRDDRSIFELISEKLLKNLSENNIAFFAELEYFKEIA